MTGYNLQELEAFVTESNAIENINRRPFDREIEIHRWFFNLAPRDLNVDPLCDFIYTIESEAVLRKYKGINVVVGNHYPPPGGPRIVTELSLILDNVYRGATPYETHHAYETLHPFTDGNGRSGRALWAWQMLHQDHPWGLRLGFLRAWYYQSLEAGRGQGG